MPKPDPVAAVNVSTARVVPRSSVFPTLMRRLYVKVGRKGMAAIITLVSLLTSLGMTASLSVLFEFEAKLFWVGVGVSTLVPLLVAPPVSMFFSSLTQHLMELESSLQDLAMRDALTGVPNRRWIIGQCEAALTAGDRQPVGVLMIDVDHFKSINDRFGHEAGDRALRAVAQALTARLRAGDRLGRYGGEEFLVMTQDRTPYAVQQTADALRRALQMSVAGEGGLDIPISVSIGGALVSGGDMSRQLSTALRRADSALYRAKSDGRNRVVIDAWPMRPSDEARTSAVKSRADKAPADKATADSVS